VNRRTKPELEVLRNFNPTFPEGFTHTARAKAGTVILSGQLIVLNSDGEWEVAANNTGGDNVYDNPTLEIFIALKDSVSYDAMAFAGADYNAAQGALGPNGAGFSDVVSTGPTVFTAKDTGTFMSPTGGAVVGYSTQGQYLFQSAYFDTGTYTPGKTFLTVSSSVDGNIMPATAINTSKQPIIGRVDRKVHNLNGVNSNVPASTNVLTWKTGYLPTGL
jgi:hypothetical protein